jgi:hypothetical protein
MPAPPDGSLGSPPRLPWLQLGIIPLHFHKPLKTQGTKTLLQFTGQFTGILRGFTISISTFTSII